MKNKGSMKKTAAFLLSTMALASVAVILPKQDAYGFLPTTTLVPPTATAPAESSVVSPTPVATTTAATVTTAATTAAATTAATVTTPAATTAPTTSSSTGGSSGGVTPRVTSTVKQGWILENEANEDWKYYSGTTRDSLKKGWHLDPQDGRWYYLRLSDGLMLKEWQNIDGVWYYFNPYTAMWTWEKHSDGEWYYKKIPNSRPLGSMYSNETTPDGYFVNANGAWVK